MSFIDSLFVYPPDSNVGTFSYDDKLPPLPLQTLDKTLQVYYNSLLPLATDQELNSAKKVIDSFKNGVGKKLDDMLQEKAKKEKNWLDEWWDKYAYLSGRYPLVPFCNMFAHSSLDDLYEPSPKIALQISAIDLYYLIEFWRLLRREKVKLVNDPSIVFGATQFRRLYNTVRIPGEKIDSLINYFKTEKEGACPEHIIIIRNGRIFKIDVNVNGHPISPSQLEHAITYIKNICEGKSGQGIGYMTCDERTNWAQNRKHLQSLSEHNKKLLQLIEESILVASLDKSFPKNTTESCTYVMCDNYESRWADKSISLVYFDNGFVAGMCDHTAFDGTISGVASFYVYSKLREGGIDYKEKPGEKYNEPLELIFDVDDTIKYEIGRLKRDLQQNKQSVKIISEAFKGFGKSYLKEIKIHPDAFVQMGIQLTYYKLHGKVCATYETATTRQYYKGRTETLRSCTLEALQWVKKMCDANESISTKTKYLRTATSKHNQLMTECKKNAGCDRHLFGLYCMALDNNIEIPDFFAHDLFTRSGGNGNFILSTSLSGYMPIGGAVAPMCLDGYGVFYSICDNEIRFYITTYTNSIETNGRKFFDTLCESFLDMRNLFLTEGHSSKL